ncbi:hypothetical protein LCGC14_2647160, partial [marine sediment metagenome]
RIEHENYTDVIDMDKERITPISKNAYAVLDGWVREEIPELVNNVLSLPWL